jgi:hypothetical protein
MYRIYFIVTLHVSDNIPEGKEREMLRWFASAANICSQNSNEVFLFLCQVRLNFKCNTLPNTIVFAYAAGYKLNFELPDDSQIFHLYRRALYENFETIIDEYVYIYRYSLYLLKLKATEVVYV